jgi:hypothetical protein
MTIAMKIVKVRMTMIIRKRRKLLKNKLKIQLEIMSRRKKTMY